ncbi:MAG: DNA topoisomerase IV subunit B [Ferrovum sp. 37-45-19]|uniref:DNA topoisomerase IV subunit B n=1 Tax=Ferrovum sp. JA12 TaxID=1356299 RepID=UPI000702DCFE|nr:DNA topoisomerase IV subunit B [Ferrovum sp. JA12]OYV80321.1 MAG: DNA topoisomerase IV subunit B [Ferrovum sp. 21-44-67]OYV95066.1 MAG: DNA topoisomerase IV subunit B [Ferrovum sp. 37-45-19]OZB31791.1 MAG: DNA topoisomerase IV subunit B [Ferrovum sp. 34-44-207]HQT80873.1 DNA topoisomerase IV subunit B [Ferrovaceae bacterium]KRH78715.1 DNA topoisomerase 4 subunit B [Ferrovum sp. JA12]
MASSKYNESSIRVLKGLEPVKERPGMYTRTQDPTHIIQEVIDNAADEALAGYATKIFVVVHNNHSITVVDNGRGIPVGIHPEEGEPTIQLVFTRLHAGGKFDKKSGQGAYAFSGGLHGVGVSVTNALSKQLDVIVKREGKIYQISFSDGNVIVPLKVIGHCDKNDTGTQITVTPDPKYFDQPHVSVNELERVLRSKAVLLPGVEVNLQFEKDLEHLKTWKYPEGLKGYLDEISDYQEPLVPIFSLENYIDATTDSEIFAEGEGAQWALAWYENSFGANESYVNLIPTAAGGTHEAGLRTGVYESIKSFIDLHGLLPRGVRLQMEDASSKLHFVLSTRILDPQFQGQTKEKLTSRDALKLVATMIKQPLDIWLNNHLDYAKKIAELVIKQAMNRMKSSQKIEKKKGSGMAVLPGKLTDCESDNINERELFLVEGDSAGGSAKLARNKNIQAILPLRGKVLNTFEVDRDRLFANNEIHDISVAIGVDPHGTDDEPDLTGLRYDKIIIMSDADVDGSHIKVLLLTLFYMHFPKLVETKHIYVASPPLFRIDVNALGKRPARKLYALDENELLAIEDRLSKEGLKPTQWSVGRFKGLGEMNPEQLWETTMNPDTRRVLPVLLMALDHQHTHATFSKLMGKGEASARREWMEENGSSVEVDI